MKKTMKITKCCEKKIQLKFENNRNELITKKKILN